MARAKKAEAKESFKEFKYDGKEFQYTGRIYPENKKETKKCDITPMNLTLNGLITIKGCKLFQSDKNSWIQFPQYQSGDDYKDYIYYPKELNDELDALVEEIEKALDA